MLRLSDISLSFGGQDLLHDLSIHIRPTDRIGLIGNNGTGKSTLLKIIAGSQEVDGGTIAIASSKKIEYLSQEIAGQESQMPLLEYLCAAKKELTEIEEEMERLSTLLDNDPDVTISYKLCELQERYEHCGGYTKESEARQIVSGLGFSKSDYDKKLSEFSGGFRMRAHLGRLLFSSPDLLLLDEPTNHLDIESTEWLEKFITKKFQGALVIVSHDRYFLNRMVNKIAEVDNKKVTLWPHNYDRYLIEKEKRKKIIEKAASQQASEIEKTEKFIERFRAKSTKAKQVKSRIKSLEKIERIVTDRNKKSIGFTFRSTTRGNDILLTLDGVAKSYGTNIVYESLDFKIKRGERIALVGPNGAGKSTLLKLCAGIIEPDEGAITFGTKTERGWFAQHQLEALDVSKTLYEEISSSVSFESQPMIRHALGAFLFHGDDVSKKVGVLSGGEKSRTALCKLALTPTNLLLLDEPTNHLDIESRFALENALKNYGGAILFISHDRAFIDSVAQRIVRVDEGKVEDQFGSYADYEKNRTVNDRKKGTTSNKKKQRKYSALDRKGGFKNFNSLKKEFEKAELKLSGLTTLIAEIEKELGNPEIYKNGDKSAQLSKTLKTKKSELDKITEQWVKVGEELENAGIKT